MVSANYASKHSIIKIRTSVSLLAATEHEDAIRRYPEPYTRGNPEESEWGNESYTSQQDLGQLHEVSNHTSFDHDISELSHNTTDTDYTSMLQYPQSNHNYPDSQVHIPLDSISDTGASSRVGSVECQETRHNVERDPPTLLHFTEALTTHNSA